MSDTLLLAVILIPCLVVAIVFHEVSHGWAALMLGDPTAKERRRLSLNPLRHVDPIGTVVLPGALALMGAPVFGWAKPVPVERRRLDNPRFGMMAVAAAGPVSNFAMAAVGAVAFGLLVPIDTRVETGATGLSLIVGPGGAISYLGSGLLYFVLINVFIGVFNLLPIPPFDGSHIVEGAMPRRWVHAYEKLRPFGMILFIGLIALTWFAPGLGVLENTVGPPVNWALERYFGLADWIAGR